VKQKKSRAAKRRQQLVARHALPPLRGSKSFFALFPWAYAHAHGYVLPSLRDSGNAQLQNLRFGLRKNAKYRTTKI
jgi:hypothetical protein